ncbi:MAG: phage integrase N-terminal SAM-like domain-containing protein, partial [Brevundimonas sp.]
MNRKTAMELFERGMREERKARATMETYRSHVNQFLSFSSSSSSSSPGTVEERLAEYLSWLAHNRAAATQAQA